MAKKNSIVFNKRLVLNKFLLSQIGMTDFEEIRKAFRSPELEKINYDGRSKYAIRLCEKYKERLKISEYELKQYDDNIVKALKKINSKRENEIELKYFQYFSLLFVEIYLDKYFSDKQGFVAELNTFLVVFNSENNDDLSPFTEENINKLALWSATASGKTILMHLNFYQILYYIEKYNINFEGSYILLTPNEGLSNQHLNEFDEAGINAGKYDKTLSRLFSKDNRIEIIENTKLADKDGEKTVAVSRFGNQNVVFVDEGHRGTSGDTWYSYRNELCEKGFSFEYSATFGQAVNASNKKSLEEEYAKCIYFDYSYKYFYNDGFGKDYQILNLNSDEELIRKLYLTVAMLTFYQQKKLYAEHKEDYKKFNLKNPLMIFVGGSVNAVRTSNKREVSDVVDVLLFLDEFTNDCDKYIDVIDRILNEKTGLLDSKNMDVFRGKFDYINSLSLSPQEVYHDLIFKIFHEDLTGSILYIEYLKGSDGEIRLRLGQNDPFGLINVGDATRLIKLCKENNLNAGEIDFSESIFSNINKESSPLNILIGSKKFSEGWNSWRVSSMGLMNIGKSEGSQIIQLFGRGVRLKGKNNSLKRSSAYFTEFPYEEKPVAYENLKYLETLNVFGVYADYMAQFKEYLETEGIDINDKPWIISIPIIKNKPKNKVLTLKVKDKLDFKRDGNSIIVGENTDKFIIDLDCYGKVQFQASNMTLRNKIEKDVNYFTEQHLMFLDYDKIYFEIQKYKGEKNYCNMSITRENVQNLLNDRTWYRLFIPQEDMQIRFLRDFGRFNRIAIALLKKYMDKKYSVSRSKWESPLLKYDYIDENDVNYVREDLYNVEISNQEENIMHIEFLKYLRDLITEKIAEKKNPEIYKLKGSLGAVALKPSLYNPYLYASKDNIDIKVTPVALNESEMKFVSDLKIYLEKHKDKYDEKEIYIIRNVSKKGVGFFEDNGFYPDFILWIIDKASYHMVFVEPHGMIHEDINSEKVLLCERIKEYENAIDKNEIDEISPILDSFILSPTKYREMVGNYLKSEWNKKHVLFMDDKNYIEQLFDMILE